MGFINRWVIGILLGSLIFLASGCMLAGNKCITSSGSPVDKKALSQIVIGETTKTELIALLGAPTSTSVSKDKTEETLKYRHTKTTSNQSVLIFIWAINDTDVKKNTVIVKLKDGVVKSYHTES